MWEVPRALSIVAGSGEGRTELTAFDRALMDAGIANMNFLRVTSIVPAGAEVIPVQKFTPGTLMPAVYARIASRTPGERIAATIGVGISRRNHGVIMEHTHVGTAADAEEAVRAMVEEAMAFRELRIDEVLVACRDHVVRQVGCAVAAVVFWR
jgi:arginine decarboxylase